MPVQSQLSYVDPPPSTSGIPDWQSDRYVNGRFELLNLRTQSRRQEHEFWAGVALGVGGAALIGAIQTFALISIKRSRKRIQLAGWTRPAMPDRLRQIVNVKGD